MGNQGPCEGTEGDLRHCQSSDHWTADTFCEHDEDVVLECRYGYPGKDFDIFRPDLQSGSPSNPNTNRFETDYDEDEFEEEPVQDDPLIPVGALECGNGLLAPRIKLGNDTVPGQHP